MPYASAHVDSDASGTRSAHRSRRSADSSPTSADMKIVQLSKNDRSGGAARAAYRLHQSLRLVGQHSVMVVESPTSDDPTVGMFEKPLDRLDPVRRGQRQVRGAGGPQ